MSCMAAETQSIADARSTRKERHVDPLATPYSADAVPSSATDKEKKSPPSYNHFFPLKLFEMLADAESLDLTGAVSWRAEGRAFLVKDREMFMTRLYPRYFKATKYRSFQRQCGLWGFRR